MDKIAINFSDHSQTEIYPVSC